MQPLNNYGDKMHPTSGSHGADITSQRMDELDVACLQYALSLNDKAKYGLDIGCGHGAQGIRLAMLDTTMLLIDRLDIEAYIEQVAGLFSLKEKLMYLKKDARNITEQELSDYHLIYSQRFIHYLPFREAETLISLLTRKLYTGGKLFISASGLNSELGIDYPAAAYPIHERFSKLHPDIARKHNIEAPVCLYTPEELNNLLLQQGLQPDKIWSSPFGNVKAIATKAL